MRFTRIVALFLTLPLPFAAYAQKSKKPTPQSRTIEGSVIRSDGMAGMSNFTIESGTRPYKDSSPQAITRVTNSNDDLVLFGLGSNGKWQWLRFLQG
jgi:hypothetical protein